MSERLSSPSNGAIFDGSWLRRERERLAIGRPSLAERLQVPQSAVQKVETKGLPVPDDWLQMLARFGFRLQRPSPNPSAAAPIPASPGVPPPERQSAPANESLAPAQTADAEAPAPDSAAPEPAEETPSTPAEPRPTITGSWLRTFRHEHRLSLEQISQRLQIPVSTISYYERLDRPLPGWWLSTLIPLAEYTPPPDLIELIVTYRLQFGRSAGQSAVEVLAWIAHDLRASGAEKDISYAEVEAALDRFLTQRRERGRAGE